MLEVPRELIGFGILCGGMTIGAYVAWTSFRAVWNDKAFDGDDSKRTMSAVFVDDVKGLGRILNPMGLYRVADSGLRTVVEKYL